MKRAVLIYGFLFLLVAIVLMMIMYSGREGFLPPTASFGRIFTQRECKEGLRGHWVATGECLKRGGGSFSWDMRNNPRSLRIF